MPDRVLPGIMDNNERFEKSMKKFIEINGKAGKDVYDRLSTISPAIARQMVASFGESGAPLPISSREREIAIIAALTTLGFALPQLKVHINAGLNIGLKKDEIIVVIGTMTSYAGFPATLNALFTAQEVFEERGLA
jgi:4-carboxymuconolactone decarboxylase